MPTTLPHSYPVTRTETTLSTNGIDTSPERKKQAQMTYFKIRVEISAAIVDRLTFAGQIIETGTTSYRLVHARKSRPAS